ncbi:MAG TPA: serine/threonine-protein kinase, partial [Gemmatimonadaceae bacterium]|nr:serine/threonine-protein kinase [Gemmatimonadaceae bacterium]
MKTCPTCGTEYPVSERFCPKDGSALRSADVHADLVGQVVAERYHVLQKLGEGGMGQVYLAEHVRMARRCAVKVMSPNLTRDPDAVSRFNREAANASRITHPNVAAIYDFGETSDGLIYLAMEFVDGEPLTKLIQRLGALPLARAVNIARQTADALTVAHELGIVHRDLKPDNIMIGRGREGADMVKVVDFGIAKASQNEAQKVTKTGLVVGTPEYMSPEQLAGDKLDGRSDVYSLGLVTFVMLTGKLPFP